MVVELPRCPKCESTSLKFLRKKMKHVMHPGPVKHLVKNRLGESVPYDTVYVSLHECQKCGRKLFLKRHMYEGNEVPHTTSTK